MMYLLLRDNKQSGPYSVDDLKAKGLKAYDLVWVEGRSAAWRYPSEIDELSSFAPAVEEQPFDRFFKKPAAAAQASAQQTVAQPEGKTAVTVSQPATSSNPATRRTIYVTMPGGMAAREAMRETSPVREVVRENSPVREVVREIVPLREPVMPVREISPVREITPLREAASPRERVSYHREPATEILPPLSHRKPAKVWVPAVMIGGAVLALLAAGIFIGVSIQKDRSAGSLKLASKEQPVVRTVVQQLPVPSPTSTTTTVADVTAKEPVSTPITPANSNGTPADRPAVKPRVTTPKQKTELAKTPAGIPVVSKDSTAALPADSHREAVHRTDALQSTMTDNRESLRLTLANQVSVGANKYGVGTFGGIHNLQVTVTNRSSYALDLVVVAVSYIQANKKTYKTENLYFRGIAPGSALMLEAPKTSRGISVEYKITSINSKELGLSQPGT
jgi:hypothetical protein